MLDDSIACGLDAGIEEELSRADRVARRFTSPLSATGAEIAAQLAADDGYATRVGRRAWPPFIDFRTPAFCRLFGF